MTSTVIYGYDWDDRANVLSDHFYMREFHDIPEKSWSTRTSSKAYRIGCKQDEVINDIKLQSKNFSLPS